MKTPNRKKNNNSRINDLARKYREWARSIFNKIPL